MGQLDAVTLCSMPCALYVFVRKENEDPRNRYLNVVWQHRID